MPGCYDDLDKDAVAKANYYQEYMRRNFGITDMDIKTIENYRYNDVIATDSVFKNRYPDFGIFGFAGMSAKIIEERENLQMNAIKIKKVIKNNDAVIVLWTDKTKTVVKLMAGDTDDIYSAVAQAMAKKIYGGTGKFHSHVNKVLKDYTTPMMFDKNSTIYGFKKFFDGIWNLSHPKGTDRYSGPED